MEPQIDADKETKDVLTSMNCFLIRKAGRQEKRGAKPSCVPAFLIQISFLNEGRGIKPQMNADNQRVCKLRCSIRGLTPNDS
jgi:hypothetical protein